MASSKTVLSVQGMTCKSCTTAIESKIGQLKGVEDLSISLEKGEVYVTLEPHSRLSPQMVAETISDMGFIALVKNATESQDVVFYFKGICLSIIYDWIDTE